MALREGECEFPVESESEALWPFRSVVAVLGRGISPRISETDLCLMAPDDTLVVIRSKVGAVATGVEGVFFGGDIADAVGVPVSGAAFRATADG